jgi:hypothetical protein
MIVTDGRDETRIQKSYSISVPESLLMINSITVFFHLRIVIIWTTLLWIQDVALLNFHLLSKGKELLYHFKDTNILEVDCRS